MRYLKTKTCFVLLLLLLPGAVSAAFDISLKTGTLTLSYEQEAVPSGDVVEVRATAEEIAGDPVQAEAVLLVNDEEIQRIPVVLDGNESAELTILWTVDLLPGSIADLTLRLETGEFEDVNPANNEISLIGLQIVDSAQAVAQEQMLLTQEEQAGEHEPIADIQPVVIHTEKLSWNTFRFRPALMMPEDENSYIWDFGDGVTSNRRVNEHEYAKPGIYQVQLQILSDQGSREVATTQVQVGFFHLANWRLWALILLLGAIILVAGIIAGLSEKQHPDQDEDIDLFGRHPEPKTEKKGFFHAFKKGNDQNEEAIHSPSQSGGDFDLYAESGVTKDQLEDELSFLEELKTEDTPHSFVSEKASEPEVAAQVAVKSSQPTKIPVKTQKKDTAKKTVSKKKKSTKKKTKAKSAKKKPAKKKTAKSKSKKGVTKKTKK